MGSDLFNVLGSVNNMPNSNMRGFQNMNQFITAFNEYGKNFQGDPRQIGMNMLQTNPQFKQWYNNQAPLLNQLYSMLPK